MAGSKQRVTILGNTIAADSDVIQVLRKLPRETLKPVFDQAKDHGSSPIMIGGAQYFMQRQSDHTFLCTPGTMHRVSL